MQRKAEPDQNFETDEAVTAVTAWSYAVFFLNFFTFRKEVNSAKTVAI